MLRRFRVANPRQTSPNFTKLHQTSPTFARRWVHASSPPWKLPKILSIVSLCRRFSLFFLVCLRRARQKDVLLPSLKPFTRAPSGNPSSL